MGSSTCCTSREPPSPDGEPPRPATLSSNPRKKNSKELFPQPILLAPSWSISLISKPEDAAELRAIFEDEGIESEPGSVSPKKITGALGLVKTKLRKHLSLESHLSRRHSRSNVNRSEEDIERRKELRRLRQDRIREELSSEEIYDEDAKSLSTVATGIQSEHPVRSRVPNGGDKLVVFPEFEIAGFDYPVSGETSTAENPHHADVGFNTPSLNKMKYWLDNAKVVSNSIFIQSALHRRHSSTGLVTQTTYQPSVGNDEIRCSPTRSIPASPVLEPRRLLSIADSEVRRPSWRLSFAAEDRATRLRALSQESTPYSPFILDTLGRHTNATEWQCGQGLRICSQSMTESGSIARDIRTPATHPRFCFKGEDFGGIDGSKESEPGSIPASVHLYDMKISERLGSKGLTSAASSPQLSDWGSRSLHESASAGNVSRRFRSLTSSGKGSTGWATIYVASSCYPSTDEIPSTTPQRSLLNLQPFLTGQKNWPSLQAIESGVSNIPCATEPNNVMTLSDINSSSTSLNVPIAKYDPKSAIDGSNPTSDTESFRQRDTELRAIETRIVSFSQKSQDSQPRTPIISRFKEHFHMQHPQTIRTLRTKLVDTVKVIDKSLQGYDGSVSFNTESPFLTPKQPIYGLPGSSVLPTPISPGSHSGSCNRTSSSSKKSRTSVHGYFGMDRPSVAWRTAIQPTEEEIAIERTPEPNLRNTPAKSNSQRQLESTTDIELRIPSQKAISNKARLESACTNLDVIPPHLSEAVQTKKSVSQSGGVINKIEAYDRNMRDWNKSLARQQRSAKDQTLVTPVRGRHQKRTLTPDAWARFPSHTRDERNGSAGPEDEVHHHDFANSPEKETIKATQGLKHNQKPLAPTDSDIGISENTPELKLDEINKHYQGNSLPVRLSKKIRVSLYKLRVSKSSYLMNKAYGRRSSITTAGRLEYPELELLPPSSLAMGEGESGFGDGHVAMGGLDMVQREAQADLRRSERAARMAVLGAGDSSAEFVDRERWSVDFEGKADVDRFFAFPINMQAAILGGNPTAQEAYAVAMPAKEHDKGVDEVNESGYVDSEEAWESSSFDDGSPHRNRKKKTPIRKMIGTYYGIGDSSFYGDCLASTSLLPQSKSHAHLNSKYVEQRDKDKNVYRYRHPSNKHTILSADALEKYKHKYKCNTWSGRDRAAKKFRATILKEEMDMRESTLDFKVQVEAMEKMEFDKLRNGDGYNG